MCNTIRNTSGSDLACKPSYAPYGAIACRWWFPRRLAPWAIVLRPLRGLWCAEAHAATAAIVLCPSAAKTPPTALGIMADASHFWRLTGSDEANPQDNLDHAASGGAGALQPGRC